ncbi:hypothetical protein FB45DRAFT_1009368 [Roridomyces roridus]|uniref:BTB domain-containing protein n=1 Tax=Roridomyces roridus TaxID=1738132 RepID=A0AAD7B6J6_9AGAR|nr:hypothetical protein FB45DRAFT_1009368 [Roridomyces roridus]
MSASNRAPSPFNSATGFHARHCPCDLILSSSDDVDFHVHKFVMSESMQMTSAGADHQPASAFVSTKYFTASSYSATQLRSMETIPSTCFKGLTPYNMFGICGRIRAMLHRKLLLSVEPFRVYAIACNLSLPRSAAIQTLNGPKVPEGNLAEFNLISGTTLLVLFHLRALCAREAGKAVDNHKFMPADRELQPQEAPVGDNLCWWSTTGHVQGCGGSIVGNAEETIRRPAAWFEVHMARVHAAVTETPSGEVAAAAVLDLDSVISRGRSPTLSVFFLSKYGRYREPIEWQDGFPVAAPGATPRTYDRRPKCGFAAGLSGSTLALGEVWIKEVANEMCEVKIKGLIDAHETVSMSSEARCVCVSRTIARPRRDWPEASVESAERQLEECLPGGLARCTRSFSLMERHAYFTGISASGGGFSSWEECALGYEPDSSGFR